MLLGVSSCPRNRRALPLLEGGELVGDNNGSGNLGCRKDNPTCNEAQLLKDNTINKFEPQLRDPGKGDFRLAANSNLMGIAAVTIPDFLWGDAPAKPVVPMGELKNMVEWDYLRVLRKPNGPVGAYGVQ